MREVEASENSAPVLATLETAEAAATIRPFLRLDRLSAIGGLTVIIVAWLFGLRELGLVIAGASVVVLIAMLTGALSSIERDEVMRSLVLATAGNWLVAVVVGAVIPQLWPVMIMTVLMPVVLATPFVEKRALVVLLSATATVVSLVSAAGLLNDDGGVVPDLEDELELVLVIGAVIALTIPIALIVRNNNQLLQARLHTLGSLNAELDASQHELAASRRRVVEAGDVARRRIERDLHDGAQQRLVSLSVRLRLLESMIGPSHELNANIQALIGEADGAIEDLRRLAQGIYPPLLESGGLEPALRAAVRRSALTIETDVAEIGRLDASHERALYFVALEALTNTAKYAPEAEVDVRLTRTATEVLLTVTDNGPGFDLSIDDHRQGTHNMNDRVASVGGVLSINSTLGSGTSVMATIPWSPG